MNDFIHWVILDPSAGWIRLTVMFTGIAAGFGINHMLKKLTKDERN